MSGVERIPYDEFGLFHENAEEYGLPFGGPPTVRREFVDVGDGRRLSALVWGTGDPELVLLHGGGQNAHTWDTVAMASGRPLVAIDLPGHGHSDRGRVSSFPRGDQCRGRRPGHPEPWRRTPGAWWACRSGAHDPGARCACAGSGEGGRPGRRHPRRQPGEVQDDR